MKGRKTVSILLVLTLLITVLPVQVFAMGNVGVGAPVLQELATHETTPAAIELTPNKYVGDDYEVEFKVNSKWPGNFNGELIVTNTGKKTLENLTLKFDFDHEISNIWNAQIVSHENGSYILKNVGWNQDIAPGKTVCIGFTGQWDGSIVPPQNYNLLIAKQEVEVTDYTIQFKVTSDWGRAFNGEISITNNTEKTIEDWTLEFDFDRNIERFWTAEITEHEGNHYIIKNAGYNANILPGKTLKLGFAGNPGKVDSEPTGYKLNRIGQEIDYTKDTDGDDLPDWFEKEIGTDLKKVDTDGDGLPDGYEYLILDTDPLKKDTDDNGIFDGDEDFDKDGLTNFDEYNLGTDPYSEDTDNDGLTDYDEVMIYGTDPLLYDTDGDGISDGDEIKLGLNPLSKYTYDGILDSKYITKQIVSEEILDSINQDNNYEMSMIINAAGLAETSLNVSESSYTEILSDNDAILGKVISLSYDELELESVTLNFKIDSDIVNNANLNFPSEPGFVGVQRYQIFRYDETYGILYPVETTFDTVNNIVTTTTSTLGDYCVIDMDQWLYGLGIDFDQQSEAGLFVQSIEVMVDESPQRKMDITHKEDIEIKEDILPKNYDEIILEQINKVCGIQDSLINRSDLSVKAGYTQSTYNPPIYNKQIDLVFVIDTSGSMSSKITQCKNNMKDLVKDLYNAGITARVAVISFDDYQNNNITYKLSSKEVWGKNPNEAYDLISQVKITSGWRENHVDALETALNLPFRNNTTKFAVLLTDEPLTTNDNNSKIGARGIARKLSDKGIITSVVCINSHTETFRPIFEETNGIKISVSSSFHTYLQIFIETVMRNNNVFITVLPNTLSTISLKSTPTRYGVIDTDGDGLADSKEIDWSFIEEKDGRLLLPTLYEYLDGLRFKDIATFSRLTKEKAEIINSIVVLPVKSNPVKKDSDGDGYDDPDDPRPLISDVIKTQLKDTVKFVPIIDSGKVYYGGDQGWFESTVGQDGGCGTVSGANIATYMAKYRTDCRNLYPDSLSSITKTDFINHMNEVYKYLTPKKIPTPKGDLALGIWPLNSFIKGFERFVNANNVGVKAHRNSNQYTNDNVKRYIKDGLKINSPVALMIGFNTKTTNIEVTAPDETWVQDISLHWVTITAIKEDLIKNKTTVKVSTWGGYAEMDLNDIIQGEKLYQAVVYFQ